MILALFGLMFVFFGCCLMPGTAGLAYYLLFTGDDGMKYMPDNPTVVVSVRVNDLINSDVATLVKKENPNSDKDATEFKNELAEVGLDPDDFDRVLFGYNATESEFLAAVFFRKPVDLPRIIKSGKLKDRKFTELTVGTVTVFEAELSAPPAIPMGFPGKTDSFKHIAYCAGEEHPSPRSEQGRAEHLEAQRQASDDREHGRHPETRGHEVICAAGDLKTVKDKYPQMVGLIMLAGIPGLDKIDGVVVPVNVKTDVASEVIVLCQTDGNAEDLRKAVSDGIKKLKDDPQTTTDGREMLDGIKYSSSGKRLLVNWSVKGPDVAKGIARSGTKNVPFQQVPGQIGPPPPNRRCNTPANLGEAKWRASGPSISLVRRLAGRAYHDASITIASRPRSSSRTGTCASQSGQRMSSLSARAACSASSTVPPSPRASAHTSASARS